MKTLSLLGSTGSIGTQTLSVLSQTPICQVAVLAARSNAALLEEQTRQFHPQAVAVYDEAAARDFRARTRDLDYTLLVGMDGLCEAAAWPAADVTLNAVVGMVGLRPTLAALSAKKPVALANKETLVAGGGLVMSAAREAGVSILPVDSEHSAIFQCLQGGGAIKKILLTASGGPFFGKSRRELSGVTADQALAHPNWDMGAKVTIDSATLMNKGLEVIEASWLFGVPAEKIQVVVHRESIVHSMVEFVDHAVIAQLGTPDMRLPIQYALAYPERLPCPVEELDLFAAAKLTFFPPDLESFPCLSIALEALRRGGLVPAAMNAANEVAVEGFLRGEIGFLDIPRIVEEATARQEDAPADSLASILQAESEAKAFAAELIARR